MELVLNKYGKTFEVKQVGNKFFYYSNLAGRWLPCKKAEVESR